MSDTEWAKGKLVEDRTNGFRGRIVTAHVQPKGEHRSYAWIERQCPNGTVEREACWLDDLVPVAEPSKGKSHGT